MKKYYFLLLLGISVSNFTYAQFKSLRVLLLDSDIVAIIDNNYPDPFLLNKKVQVTDHKSLLLMDSITIVSYLKKGKIDSKKQKFMIETSLNNTFYNDIRIPVHPEIITTYDKPPEQVTLLFAKETASYVEILYYVRINVEYVASVKDFMLWIDAIKKERSEAEKCRKYITKYFSILNNNEINKNLLFFENILHPSSDFMQYYKVKTPNAIVLTSEQKDQLKAYWQDGHYFDTIEDAEMMYSYFPEITIDFYKNKFSEIDDYNEYFNAETYNYANFLKFLLSKENKLNEENQFLINVLKEYNDNIIELKRNAYEQLVKKIQ